MMGDPPEQRDVERAKAFWAEEDVDQAFSTVFEYVDHLKRVLLRKTATDEEYVQALKLLEFLDSCSSGPHPDQDSSVVQVVIGSGGLLPADFPHSDPASPSSSPVSPICLFNGLGVSMAPSAGREELLSPLVPVQLEYHPHRCCKACLPGLPRMLQSRLRGQNPLKVPLLCGFKRLTATPLMSPLQDSEWPEDDGDWDVIYKAPCGQSLRNYDDVMYFLSATESYDILQVDFFTFSHLVQLDPLPGQHRTEEDLSRGKEPTPVELCVGDGGARPREFRYRKDRWPHGCFLSRGPALFRVCCDCSDGCSDAQRCACIAMTTGGRSYSHHRLLEPVPSGVYECGPWCGCVRSRCQNRLVQRGIRVRLQVFQTEDCGWGVRCRDDLDLGTFVCIYAGVVLQQVQSLVEPPPPKLFAADAPSDDEVEVVTEWLAPPVLEGRSNLVESPTPLSASTSPPRHVPVIQRPAEPNATPPARDKVQKVPGEAPDLKSPSAGDLPKRKVVMTTEKQDASSRCVTNGQRRLKRGAELEDVSFVDASKEGNVSRFINHSCQPNLFIQNVFTDSHDPAFPVIAFFTSRVVKSGTELTWDYSAHTHAAWGQKQEVACFCHSDGCRGWLHLEETLSDAGGPVESS